MQGLSSPISAFIADCVETGSTCTCAKQEMFTAFRAWCEQQGHKAPSQQRFSAQLKAALPDVEENRVWMADGSRPRTWTGLTLTDAARRQYDLMPQPAQLAMTA